MSSSESISLSVDSEPVVSDPVAVESSVAMFVIDDEDDDVDMVLLPAELTVSPASNPVLDELDDDDDDEIVDAVSLAEAVEVADVNSFR